MSETRYPYVLERTVIIRARPDHVFTFFTESDRWASWWGAGSRIDPVPGGAVLIRYPNGVEVVGHIVSIDAPSALVFTFGFASGAPIPPDGSRVTIRLAPHADGTRLHLRHEFADETARDAHVQGWRYQLSVFANLVADRARSRADAERLVDAWFDACCDPDAAACERQLAAIVTPTIAFRDRYGALDGIGDLVPHMAAMRRFMAVHAIRRDGPAEHCQGTILADWRAVGADDREIGRGTTVLVFDVDGRIQSVTGFWRA